MRYCGLIEIWNCAICCPAADGAIEVPGTAVLANEFTGTDDLPARFEAGCDDLTRDVIGKLDLATVSEVNGKPAISEIL